MALEIVKKDILRIRDLLLYAVGVSEWSTLVRLGGMTNHTYQAETSKGIFVIRIPGEGTETLICRSDEKISTELACELGIDAKLLYFGEDGAKVTAYVPNAQTMCADLMRQEQHIDQVAEIFQRLHRCGRNTGVRFDVFEMASNYEKIICDSHVKMYDDYETIKKRVFEIKNAQDRKQGVTLVPCHNDPLCENWVEGDGRMFLIDWEYAGMNDGMWDLADVSIEANYGEEEDEHLLYRYLGRTPDSESRMRFTANKIYLDYLWTLWGKTRVPYAGDEMEQYAYERYCRLKNNLEKY